MRRRAFLWMTAAGARAFGAAREAARGRLVQSPEGPPRLRTSRGEDLELNGDEDTLKALRDPRLAAEDFEAIGRREGGRFVVDPIFERAMFVYRRGRRLVVTYWCEVCAIRSFAPGKCGCCREETALDPRDPSLKDSDPTPPEPR